MTPIGILGGTFDPVHFGHLRTAMELLECLRLEEIRFVLCRVPPLGKKPRAAVEARLAMLEVAVRQESRFVVDERELHRDGPSYSVDTLESLRAEFPDRPLCLIAGMDAFASLPEWHRWDELLSLAHLVVAHRPGAPLPDGDALRRVLDRHRTVDPADLAGMTAGRILLHAVTQLDISSSAIRETVARGESARFLVPDRVLEFLQAEGCYARDRDMRVRA